MLWRAEGKGKVFSFLLFASPLSFLPSYLVTFSEPELALRSYILIVKGSSRRILYASSCKKVLATNMKAREPVANKKGWRMWGWKQSK
jgi:hypothetical protein